MTKYFLAFGLFLGVTSNVVWCQTQPIQLDRPDQTECPFIVPTKFIQLENGFTLEQGSKEIQNYSYPSTLIKYGLNEKFEFRLIAEWVTEKNEIQSVTGLPPLTFGFKTNICEEKGIIPIISFIGHITTANLGSKAFHTTYIAPSFRFAVQHTLTEKISLAYNFGAEWNGESGEQTYIYTLVTGVSFTDALGGFIEVYGFAPRDHKADHRFDAGLTYLIHDHCMIDISGGIGLTDNAPKNFISLGFSYRFKTGQ